MLYSSSSSLRTNTYLNIPYTHMYMSDMSDTQMCKPCSEGSSLPISLMFAYPDGTPRSIRGLPITPHGVGFFFFFFFSTSWFPCHATGTHLGGVLDSPKLNRKRQTCINQCLHAPTRHAHVSYDTCNKSRATRLALSVRIQVPMACKQPHQSELETRFVGHNVE